MIFMDMKLSELKKQIKDNIYEILSEIDVDPQAGSVVMSKTTPPAEIKKLTAKGIDVQLKEGAGIQDIANALSITPDKAELLTHALGMTASALAILLGTKVGLKVGDTINKIADRNKLKEEDEDREPTKAELEKEKVKGAPSKFKVSNDDFEDFKDKLKNLVKKIKAMEKGAEKDKKMAALKQFIKKPELVKAFKERDVEINTGGLVG